MTSTNTNKPEGMLEGIPSSLSSLERALEVSNRTVAVGFDWETVDDVWAKVDEECAELKEAYNQGDKREMELELGDVLFSLVNVARKMGIDAEESLQASCDKFTWRWTRMEKLASNESKDIRTLSMDELQKYWELAKIDEKNKHLEE